MLSGGTEYHRMSSFATALPYAGVFSSGLILGALLVYRHLTKRINIIVENMERVSIVKSQGRAIKLKPLIDPDVFSDRVSNYKDRSIDNIPLVVTKTISIAPNSHGTVDFGIECITPNSLAMVIVSKRYLLSSDQKIIKTGTTTKLRTQIHNLTSREMTIEAGDGNFALWSSDFCKYIIMVDN